VDIGGRSIRDGGGGGEEMVVKREASQFGRGPVAGRGTTAMPWCRTPVSANSSAFTKLAKLRFPTSGSPKLAQDPMNTPDVLKQRAPMFCIAAHMLLKNRPFRKHFLDIARREFVEGVKLGDMLQSQPHRQRPNRFVHAPESGKGIPVRVGCTLTLYHKRNAHTATHLPASESEGLWAWRNGLELSCKGIALSGKFRLQFCNLGIYRLLQFWPVPDHNKNDLLETLEILYSNTGVDGPLVIRIGAGKGDAGQITTQVELQFGH
jgi:hypothetical protein